MTLRKARVGLREQTFLGSTEKKVGQVVKLRRFLLVFDRSSSCRKCRGQPWSAPAWRLFPGNIHGFSMAIPYAHDIARARACKSIDRHRRCRLSSQSFVLGPPGLFLPSDSGLQKRRQWGIGDGWSASSSTNLGASTDKSPFPQSSATVFDAELVFRT